MTSRDVFEWTASAAAFLVIVVAVAKWNLVRIRRWWTAYIAADDLARHLGIKAGSKIKSLLVELQSKASLAECERTVLAKAMGVGIYCCAPNGQCVTVNAIVAKIFGMHPEDMKGYGWLKGVDEAYRKGAHDAWTWSVDKGVPYLHSYKVTPLDGSKPTWVKTEAIPVRTLDGSTILCYVGWLSECPPPEGKEIIGTPAVEFRADTPSRPVMTFNDPARATPDHRTGDVTKRTLIVDDEKDIHALSRQILGDQSQYIYVESLLEAWRKVDSEEFDTVALDLNLPDSDVVNTVSKFPKFKSKVKRLVGFTAAADVDYVRKLSGASSADAIEHKMDVLTSEKWRMFLDGGAII